MRHRRTLDLHSPSVLVNPIRHCQNLDLHLPWSHAGALRDTRQLEVSGETVGGHTATASRRTPADAETSQLIRSAYQAINSSAAALEDNEDTSQQGMRKRVQRVSLAVLPLGTSNDWAACTGIPEVS